jgi:hypothetical protein
MPAYGYLQWGDCGTIINPQMTVDYLTGSAASLAVEYPLEVTLLDAVPCAAAYTPATSGSGYQAPHLDPAPWYDPSLGDDPLTNPSAQFLGVIISSVEGLDSTVERSMETRAVGVGGGAFGPQRALQRELRFTGTLYASTCRGMEYGMTWLTHTMQSQGCSTEGLATLELWTGCPDGGTNDIELQDSRLQFRDTSLMSGPKYTDGPWETRACFLRQVEWTIGSESPYRYKCPYDKVAVSALSVAPSGDIPICNWLSDSTRVAVRGYPSSRMGEDVLNVELTAGNRPLNCDISAWVSPFVDADCRSFSTPQLRAETVDEVVNYSWVYEVGPDGSWTRYDMADDGSYRGLPSYGTGIMLGTTEGPDDEETFRDIKIIATDVSPATYSSRQVNGLLYAASFRNCAIIGADLDVSYVVDPTTSSGNLRHTRHRAIRLSNFTGTAHIEGVRIHGSTLYEGIDAGSKYPSAQLHLRDVLIEDVQISGADGGNAVLVNDGLYSFETDGVTVLRTRKNGIVLRPTDVAEGGTGIMQEATVRRFNATSNVASGASRTMLYFGNQTAGDRRTQVRLVDCWSGYDGGDNAIVVAAASTGDIPWTAGVDDYFRDYAEWLSGSGAAVYGRFYREDPTADFVTAGMVGAGRSDFDGAFGEACANFMVRDLPIGYRLVIDSAKELISVYDRAGVLRDGSPYVATTIATGYQWLIFDRNPMCLLINQRHAFDGDGATVHVTQTHRDL